MGHKSWTDDEEQLLKKVVQDNPPRSNYPKLYQGECQKHGLTIRSADAVYQKLQFMRQQEKGKRPKTYKWSNKELGYLQELVGDYPLALVVKYFNNWAKANNYRERGWRAIQGAIYRNGWSAVPYGEFITLNELAKILGLSNSAVRRWMQAGYIKPHTCKDIRSTGGNTDPSNDVKCRRYIRRHQITHLAKHHPHLFAGVPLQDLKMLLEWPHLAEEIHEKYPLRWGRPRAVRWNETGRIYPSLAACGKAHGVEYWRIGYSINSNGSVRGKTFSYVTPGPVQGVNPRKQ